MGILTDLNDLNHKFFRWLETLHISPFLVGSDNFSVTQVMKGMGWGSWSVFFGSGMLMDPFAPCDPEDPTVEAEVDIGTSVTVGCGMCREGWGSDEPNCVDSPLRLQVRWTQIKPPKIWFLTTRDCHGINMNSNASRHSNRPFHKMFCDPGSYRLHFWIRDGRNLGRLAQGSDRPCFTFLLRL